MTLQTLIDQKNLTRYRVAKACGIPQSTLKDLCSGKTDLAKANAETVYKIAKTLDTTVEALLEIKNNTDEDRMDFELYKSSICHKVKDLGDIPFLLETLQSDEIRKLYSKKWYAESFYLLAMVDYLSRLHHIDKVNSYDDIRMCKLKEPLYPASAWISYYLRKDRTRFESCDRDAIPEFKHFNIIESEIRNVI